MFNSVLRVCVTWCNKMTPHIGERARERERIGFPVSPTNERIPHADTGRRIRRTRELQRTNAIGADEVASDSATQAEEPHRNLATCLNHTPGRISSQSRRFRRRGRKQNQKHNRGLCWRDSFIRGLTGKRAEPVNWSRAIAVALACKLTVSLRAAKSSALRHLHAALSSFN